MTKLKILYVEDEPDIRLVAKKAMQALGGFEVCECASGQAAIEAAETFLPDILVLDVMMPGMNGPETLKNLRLIPGLDSTPAIFMTAKVQAGEISEYLAMGALGVIAKPFDPMTLSQQIEDLWKSRNLPRSGTV